MHFIESTSAYAIKVIIIHSKLYPEDHFSLVASKEQKICAKKRESHRARDIILKTDFGVNKCGFSRNITLDASQNGIYQVCWNSALWCNFAWLDNVHVVRCTSVPIHIHVSCFFVGTFLSFARKTVVVIKTVGPNGCWKIILLQILCRKPNQIKNPQPLKTQHQPWENTRFNSLWSPQPLA